MFISPRPFIGRRQRHYFFRLKHGASGPHHERAVKKTEGTRESARFLGINVHKVKQYTDATSTKQIIENPKKIGSTRNLGIRWHLVRHGTIYTQKTRSFLTASRRTALPFLGPNGWHERSPRDLRLYFSIAFRKRGKKDLTALSLEHICRAGILPNLIKHFTSSVVSLGEL
jgi:hypothetical protein